MLMLPLYLQVNNNSCDDDDDDDNDDDDDDDEYANELICIFEGAM